MNKIKNIISFRTLPLLQERIRRDLELENQVQKSFLPFGFPEISGSGNNCTY